MTRRRYAVEWVLFFAPMCLSIALAEGWTPGVGGYWELDTALGVFSLLMFLSFFRLLHASQLLISPQSKTESSFLGRNVFINLFPHNDGKTFFICFITSAGNFFLAMFVGAIIAWNGSLLLLGPMILFFGCAYGALFWECRSNARNNGCEP